MEMMCFQPEIASNSEGELVPCTWTAFSSMLVPTLQLTLENTGLLGGREAAEEWLWPGLAG